MRSILCSIFIVGLVPACLCGQSPNAPRVLSQNVRIDQIDSATRLQLTRAEALMADAHWDDALDIFFQIIREHGQQLVSSAVEKKRLRSV